MGASCISRLGKHVYIAGLIKRPVGDDEPSRSLGALSPGPRWDEGAKWPGEASLRLARRQSAHMDAS